MSTCGPQHKRSNRNVPRTAGTRNSGHVRTGAREGETTQWVTMPRGKSGQAASGRREPPRGQIDGEQIGSAHHERGTPRWRNARTRQTRPREPWATTWRRRQVKGKRAHRRYFKQELSHVVRFLTLASRTATRWPPKPRTDHEGNRHVTQKCDSETGCRMRASDKTVNPIMDLKILIRTTHRRRRSFWVSDNAPRMSLAAQHERTLS